MRKRSKKQVKERRFIKGLLYDSTGHGDLLKALSMAAFLVGVSVIGYGMKTNTPTVIWVGSGLVTAALTAAGTIRRIGSSSGPDDKPRQVSSKAA